MILLLVAAVGLGVLTAYAPLYAFAVVAAALLGWLTILRPAFAAVMLAAWLPLEGFVLKLVPIGAPALVVSEFISLSILFWTMSQLLKRDNEELTGRPSALWPIVVLAAAAGVSFVVNVPPAIDALYWFRVNLRFVPLAVACLYAPFATEVRARIVGLAVFTAITQGFVGLLQLVGGPDAARFFWPGQFSLGGVATQGDTFFSVSGRYVAGTLGHYNIYGLLMVVCAGVLLSSLLDDLSHGTRSTGRLREMALATAALMVVMSQSRQAIAIGALLIPLVMVMGTATKEARLGRRIATVVGIVVAATLGALSVASELTSRVAWVLSGNYFQYEAAMNRGYVVGAVTRAVAGRNPLFGMGPGSFGTSYGSDTGPVGVTTLGLDIVSSRYVGDVGWVSLFAQTGLAGFVGALGIAAMSLRAFLDKARSISIRGFGYTIACVLGIGMLASTPMVYKSVSALLWLLIGLVNVAEKEGDPSGRT